MAEEPLKAITRREYAGFNRAYQLFNTRLFENILPSCLITLRSSSGMVSGYFSGERYGHRELDTVTDEIALNPRHFSKRSDIEILSTLVHEMVHLWQEHFGKPGRKPYHNKEWANQMESIGLMPSDTGMLGGKRTGDRMSHYVIPNGRFERATKRLLADGFRVGWQDRRRPAPNSKTKFTCPACRLSAWSKPSAKLKCGRCNISMVKQKRRQASDSRSVRG